MEKSLPARGAELLADVPALTERLVIAIQAETGSYPDSPSVSTDDLRQSCAHNLTELLQRLSGQPGVDPEAPVVTGRRRAEQGFPLADVLHAFRLGGRIIWDELVVRARAEGPEATAALIDTAATLWEIIDGYSILAANAYQARMFELTRLDAERQTLVVDSVLAGLGADAPTLSEAAASLSLPLYGSFLLVSSDGTAAGAVERAVNDELRGRGGTAAWRLRHDRYLGVVSLGASVGYAQVRDALEGVAVGRVGLSPLFTELAATPEAMRLADVARVSLPPGSKGVVAYDDHPVRVLVASDADAARRAARAILEPVLALDPETRSVLLDTLRVWCAAGGSAAAAGKLLFCHRNTVRNRLQRIEELTGRSLEDPRGVAELYLASEAVSLLGP